MSSFIPSPEHFNSCERALTSLVLGNKFYLPYSLKTICPNIYRKYGIDNMANEIAGLFDTLRELTALCVTLQYKSHYEGKLDKEIEDQKAILIMNKKQSEDLNKPALYKALSCLNYQIEIEGLKDLRELTADESNAMLFLKEVKTALAEDIVSNLPVYDSAKWSL